MSIRTATLTDAPGIARLHQQLIGELAQLNPTMFQPLDQPDLQAVAQYIVGDSATAFVHGHAPDDAFATVTTATTGKGPGIIPHRFAYLVDIYVAPSVRRQGVATELLTAVRQWARDQSLDFIQLNVAAQNDAATALYHQLGYKPQYTTLQQPLTD
ncbi:hypothetical protein FC50_GL000765 [Lacticaseibacillus pantheris DSM 15945 = JCM 12539 = NBRC 106106]|uniref:N-acetyltransferase domain-containing protein n=1 Tax=Lacticaseibacillus pantheris DSM 15945 = JCM 12539 = NBRC 106106 TaxID=1423783 RepID=A0A0R1U1W0_9LACO|nr:GNAT family N-acetyltransferase [Lacticaseibacillus pantheris]KRL86516.1 hypothetical protein FC50_GL000765 [Lacticaseibacillus pantheris DSM 15945 = JCM 12539 = NBRC 106106]